MAVCKLDDGLGEVDFCYSMEKVEKKASSDVWTPPVVDMADPSAPAIISKVQYTQVTYVRINH